MEALLIGLGAVALVPFIAVVLIGASLWTAWWIHPLWSLVVVPLGAPSIGFWHFAAFLVLIRTLTYRDGIDTHAKESDSAKQWSNIIGYFVGIAIGPPITYVFVRWLMP